MREIVRDRFYDHILTRSELDSELQTHRYQLIQHRNVADVHEILIVQSIDTAHDPHKITLETWNAHLKHCDRIIYEKSMKRMCPDKSQESTHKIAA